MSSKNFLFSVVVPIYNVELYLEETIKSVIRQTIGFENNIQMILVNDGSPDNSEEICLKYKAMYPNNIIYVKQENAGVSSARNNGLKYATGKYVNFLDSDDKWSSDSYAKIYDFLQNNPTINFVCGRMKFFEGSNKMHQLDYKFNKKTRIIDIEKEPSCIHLHITSSVIRLETAKKYSFDKRLKYGEDAKFVNDIILNEGKYAVIKEAVHYYRKRINNSSAIQNKESNSQWYNECIKLFYNYIIDVSIKKYKKVNYYTQYLLCYELGWRLRSKNAKLTSLEMNKYLKHIKRLVNYIDDEVIRNQLFIYAEHKKYMYELKHGNINDNIRIKNIENSAFQGVFYNDYLLTVLQNRFIFKINIFEVNNNIAHIEGQINTILDLNKTELYYKNNKDKYIKVDTFENHLNPTYILNELVKNNHTFIVDIDINGLDKIQFFFKQGKKYYQLFLNYGSTARLSLGARTTIRYDNKLFYHKNMSINIINNTLINRFKFGMIYYLSLLKNKRIKVILFRLCANFLKLFKRKEIWLVSDRPNTATDNGYYFYKYLMNQKIKNKNIYFVLQRSSESFDKVKSLGGKVLDYDSLKYKVYFLLADKIISSQADDWVTNAFGKMKRFYQDMYNFKFVFLQHGIIKDDLSLWLHKHNKNIKMFVTAAKPEYNSIINGKYGYDESVVKLVGLPRFDTLIDDRKKQIAIMPTWRHDLQGKIENGIRTYNKEFINSEYFNFYNNLINDEKLLKIMREKGYKGVFVVHTCHLEQYDDFKFNDVFQKGSKVPDYQQIFRESSLLITDYSSVPFDFAYLRKPVIYTQFDRENFFKTHTYKEGYFDYEKEGFGPVTYDYASTVKLIIDMIKNDCKSQKKYDERIDRFYTFNDKNNCKRVYEQILKL